MVQYLVQNMSMIKKAVWQLLNYLNKYIAAPRMILGYTRHDGVYLAQTRMSNTTHITYPQHLHLENNIFIWHHTIIECSHGVTIGEGCQIGANVLIASHSSHIAIRLYGKHYIGQPNYTGYITGSVTIGKYTFIGPYSTIMPNTIIGKGCIVTAYSLVKGTFPDFAIISGNPGQVVGDTRTIDKVFLENNPQLQQYYDQWVNE